MAAVTTVAAETKLTSEPSPLVVANNMLSSKFPDLSIEELEQLLYLLHQMVKDPKNKEDNELFTLHEEVRAVLIGVYINGGKINGNTVLPNNLKVAKFNRASLSFRRSPGMQMADSAGWFTAWRLFIHRCTRLLALIGPLILVCTAPFSHFILVGAFWGTAMTVLGLSYVVDICCALIEANRLRQVYGITFLQALEEDYYKLYVLLANGLVWFFVNLATLILKIPFLGILKDTYDEINHVDNIVGFSTDVPHDSLSFGVQLWPLGRLNTKLQNLTRSNTSISKATLKKIKEESEKNRSDLTDKFLIRVFLSLSIVVGMALYYFTSWLIAGIFIAFAAGSVFAGLGKKWWSTGRFWSKAEVEKSPIEQLAEDACKKSEQLTNKTESYIRHSDNSSISDSKSSYKEGETSACDSLSIFESKRDIESFSSSISGSFAEALLNDKNPCNTPAASSAPPVEEKIQSETKQEKQLLPCDEPVATQLSSTADSIRRLSVGSSESGLYKPSCPPSPINLNDDASDTLPTPVMLTRTSSLERASSEQDELRLEVGKGSTLIESTTKKSRVNDIVTSSSAGNTPKNTSHTFFINPGNQTTHENKTPNSKKIRSFSLLTVNEVWDSKTSEFEPTMLFSPTSKPASRTSSQPDKIKNSATKLRITTSTPVTPEGQSRRLSLLQAPPSPTNMPLSPVLGSG
jgi:hypothetical protein